MDKGSGQRATGSWQRTSNGGGKWLRGDGVTNRWGDFSLDACAVAWFYYGPKRENSTMGLWRSWERA